MQQQVVVISLTGPDLRTLLRGEIDDALNQKSLGTTSTTDQLLRRSDIAKMFGVTLVTVHAWMNSGKIPFHRMGGRVFFKKEEVVESMKAIKLRKK